ncbi:MAG: glycosyl hydrolase family 18 protein [Patescibacteria group bacterium]|nr:glycosyl hydrolase family 18 protein [Patescibacteria group bacterium]
MRTALGKIIFLFAVVLSALPGVSFAATSESFEISGWIPYWRASLGVESILPHIGTFTEVNPFVYTVRQNGTLNEASPLTDAQWMNLAGQSKEKGIRFIPTVMWANPDAIDDVLRDPVKRQEHVRAIVREVYARKFDGIDIDYEGKYARTKPYFSLFLKELYEAMEFDKWIMCTIEARTPLDSRYSSPESIPKDIEYANDFAEINKYCDRVRIMAYDQGRIDLKLNKSNVDPYIPVADKAWVEKVVLLATKEIDKSKIVIGVPTYGYEYDMFNALDGSGEVEYSNLWSFNPGYATDTALKLQIAPTRNSAGELFLTYPASQSLDPAIPLPSATRVMSWSDAEAIRQKAELAEKLGVRGIALFKIDGGQDAGLWDVLTQYKNKSVVFVPATISTNTSEISATVVPSRNLYFGITGEEVRTLQKFLNARGFSVSTTGGGSPGNETNYFGPATVRALIKFQIANGVKPSVGYYGPITRAAIKAL